MKKILLGVLSLITAGALNAQVEIQLDGAGPDVSGTTIDINLTPSMIYPHETHLVVTNTAASDQQLTITRVTAAPAGWNDNICWPPFCFPASGAVYSTPNTSGNPAPFIVSGTNQTTNNELAELKPQVTPDQSANSTQIYTYYITDTNGVYVDSVALRFNFTLGLEEAPSLAVNVAPNPADNLLKISATGSNDATVKMVDVLGNVVLKEAVINGSKTIDVSNFRNGIYFVRVEAPGAKTVNRKVIVRH